MYSSTPGSVNTGSNAHEMEALTNHNRILQSRVEDLSDKLKKTLTQQGNQIKEHIRAQNSWREQYNALEERLQGATKDRQELNRSVAEKDKVIKDVRGQVVSLQAEMRSQELVVENAKRELEMMMAIKKDQLSHTSDLETSNQQLQRELNKLKNDYSDSTIQSDNQRQQLLTQMEVLRIENANATATISHLEAQTRAQSGTQQELNNLLTGMKAEMISVSKSLQEERSNTTALASENKRLVDAIAAVTDEKKQVSRNYDNAQMQIKEIESKREQVVDELGYLRKQHERVVVAFHVTEKDLKEKNEILKETDDKKQAEMREANATIKKLMAANDARQKEMDQLSTELGELRDVKSVYQRKLKELEEQKESELTIKHTELLEARYRLGEVSADLAQLNQHATGTQARSAQYEAKYRELKTIYEKAKADKEALSSGRHSLQGRVQQLEDQHEEDVARLESLQAEAEELREALRGEKAKTSQDMGIAAKFDDLQARHKELQETYESSLRDIETRVVAERNVTKKEVVEQYERQIQNLIKDHEVRSQQATLKQTLQSTNLEEVRRQINVQTETYAELNKRYNDELQEREAVQKQRDTLQQQLVTLEAKSLNFSEREASASASFRELEARRAELAIQLEAAENREKARIYDVEQLQEAQALLKKKYEESEARATLAERKAEESGPMVSSLNKHIKLLELKVKQANAFADSEIERLNKRNQVLVDSIARLTSAGQAGNPTAGLVTPLTAPSQPSQRPSQASQELNHGRDDDDDMVNSRTGNTSASAGLENASFAAQGDSVPASNQRPASDHTEWQDAITSSVGISDHLPQESITRDAAADSSPKRLRLNEKIAVAFKSTSLRKDVGKGNTENEQVSASAAVSSVTMKSASPSSEKTGAPLAFSHENNRHSSSSDAVDCVSGRMSDVVTMNSRKQSTIARPNIEDDPLYVAHPSRFLGTDDDDDGDDDSDYGKDGGDDEDIHVPKVDHDSFVQKSIKPLKALGGSHNHLIAGRVPNNLHEYTNHQTENDSKHKSAQQVQRQQHRYEDNDDEFADIDRGVRMSTTQLEVTTDGGHMHMQTSQQSASETALAIERVQAALNKRSKSKVGLPDAAASRTYMHTQSHADLGGATVETHDRTSSWHGHDAETPLANAEDAREGAPGDTPAGPAGSQSLERGRGGQSVQSLTLAAGIDFENSHFAYCNPNPNPYNPGGSLGTSSLQSGHIVMAHAEDGEAAFSVDLPGDDGDVLSDMRGNVLDYVQNGAGSDDEETDCVDFRGDSGGNVGGSNLHVSDSNQVADERESLRNPAKPQTHPGGKKKTAKKKKVKKTKKDSTGLPSASGPIGKRSSENATIERLIAKSEMQSHQTSAHGEGEGHGPVARSGNSGGSRRGSAGSGSGSGGGGGGGMGFAQKLRSHVEESTKAS